MPEAYSGVSKQIQVFASMADNPGSSAEEAVSAFQNTFLKNKSLHQGKCLKSGYGEFSWSLKNNTYEMLFTRALKISTALNSVS